MNVPRQTGEIFEILSSGQFICSNSADVRISKLYDVIDDNEKYELLYDYFSAIGFLMNYQFVRELSFEERVTVFCQIISMFENELELSDNYLKQNNIEYAVVYPK